MNQFLAIGTLLSSAIAGLGSMGPGGFACAGSGELRKSTGCFEVRLPGLGGIHASVSWESSGGPPPDVLHLTNSDDEPLRGCIVFYDENGNEIGRTSGTIPAGGKVVVSVPSGSVSFSVETDCEEEDDDEKDSKLEMDEDELDVEEHPYQLSSQGQQGKTRRQDGPRTFRFENHTIEPRSDRDNVSYVLDVTASDARAARRAVSTLREQGLAGPWPSTVQAEVLFYSEAQVASPVSGDVVLTFADDDRYESMELYLNGTLLADLDDATSVVTGNGWDGVRFVIPGTAFAYDPTPGAVWRNEIEVRYQVQGSPAEHVFLGLSEYQTPS